MAFTQPATRISTLDAKNIDGFWRVDCLPGINSVCACLLAGCGLLLSQHESPVRSSVPDIACVVVSISRARARLTRRVRGGITNLRESTKWQRAAKDQLDVAQQAFDSHDYGLTLRAAHRIVRYGASDLRSARAISSVVVSK